MNPRAATLREPPDGQILIYQDGATRLQVRLEGRTVWLAQRFIAELFQVLVPTVNEHLAGIYADGELEQEATIRRFRIVQREGSREISRAIDHYNLDAILAVGYRVRSARGTAFRQWATAQLRDLLVKGFVLDDDRLKQGRTIGADYFDELLERIRAIRSEARMFYQKITDIYATSIDYDPTHPVSQSFFATVQNKLHFAIHGRTAAEIIKGRADAGVWKPRSRPVISTGPLKRSSGWRRATHRNQRLEPASRRQRTRGGSASRKGAGNDGLPDSITRNPYLKADYILANPPFNISGRGGERLAGDRRWHCGAFQQSADHRIFPGPHAGVLNGR